MSTLPGIMMKLCYTTSINVQDCVDSKARQNRVEN